MPTYWIELLNSLIDEAEEMRLREQVNRHMKAMNRIRQDAERSRKAVVKLQLARGAEGFKFEDSVLNAIQALISETADRYEERKAARDLLSGGYACPSHLQKTETDSEESE